MVAPQLNSGAAIALASSSPEMTFQRGDPRLDRLRRKVGRADDGSSRTCIRRTM